jgi:hypothetical protein
MPDLRSADIMNQTFSCVGIPRDSVRSDYALEPDNLIAERAIRGFTVGRRTWLFSGSLAAAQRSAVILSIIETCKANDVDAELYMADIMERIQNDWPASRWDELMPWNWSPRTNAAVAIAARPATAVKVPSRTAYIPDARDQISRVVRRRRLLLCRRP